MGKYEIISALILYTSFFQNIDGYTHCWDGTNGGMYTGTLSITTSGKTCQPWASQSPHSHSYDEDSFFPFDGSLAGANNYCRDPDFNYRPWCYTMRPGTRWEICDVPICTNLPCGTSETAGESNPASKTASVDANTNINYLATDTTYQLPCCGTVKRWRLYIRNAGTVSLQIWRHGSVTGEYVLKGVNTFTYSAAQINALHEEPIAQTARISVEEGDMIGWAATVDMISYDTGATTGTLRLSMGAPSVNQSVNFGTAATENSKDYAIGVEIAQNLAPYFTNSGNTATASDSEPVGTAIFRLFVTDDDPYDVAGLTVYMITASAFFDLNSDFEIEVKSTPLTVGTYPLQFIVKDHCDETGAYTVTVTVTQAAVVITNVPSFANVSESETTETLVHTLTFSSVGPHTCTIDTYHPTRAEGNPFLIKNTPASDVGVYLKSAAAVRYNIATSYDLTITCTDGSTSDTKVLTVTIEPNSQPTFDSWAGATTISASSTPNGQVVYTATINDDEGDPITMAMPSCTPTPCPFAVNNAGQIYATQNLLYHEVSSYDIYLSANDSFNTVTSSLLTITITDLNSKPVFTNLGGTEPVPEDTAIGAEVFQVSANDADGDTVTFTATYAPGACSSLFTMASDGRITTLASLDFETVAVTSCVLTVTANDGKVDSVPDTVTLEVTDLDEAPAFSSTLYQISTPEVVSGTVLPDPAITVTDPDGTAVTLSLNCGADSGYLSINSGTLLVTMVTAYNVDPSLPSYTITCTITATDATSQASTCSLEVEVTDANDETPTFGAGMYTINILNTQATGVISTTPVAATDADSTSPNNLITYSLTGADAANFAIDASGNILLTGDVSGVTGTQTFTFTAVATDNGTPTLSDTAVVQVIVSSTATGTTTTTTTTTTSSSGSGTGFFSSTLNIIWFAIAVALGTFVLAVAGYFLYRLCCRSKGSGARMTDYSPKHNNMEKETPVKQEPEKAVRKRSLQDTSKSKDPDRPISNDSGINVSLRTPPTPANTRFQPISVQPTDNVYTADETPRTNLLNMQDIRKWKLEQGQWRQALLAGRLKQ